MSDRQQPRPAPRPSPSSAAPAPDRPSPPVVGGSRYGWIVGIVALLLVAYISLNTLRTEGPGSTGPTPGQPLPPFAAPLVETTLEGDANVASAAGQGDAGPVPACAVDDRRALNICTLVRDRPVVLAFLTAGSKTCARELDLLEQLSRSHPEVAFAAVGIKGKRSAFRALARTRGWRFPLAHDRDGAVANLYGIAVCPTVVLARRGGEVIETVLGAAASAPGALAEKVRRLERGSTAAAEPDARARR